jgi:hypothetical protein
MLNSAAVAGTSAMGGGGGPSSYDPSRATTSSRDEAASVSLSNVSDLEATEWIEEDEPGVCLTIRELGDGTRELRRIRFRYVYMAPISHGPAEAYVTDSLVNKIHLDHTVHVCSMHVSVVLHCSRERFGEERAKVWWEQNRERIQAEYL